MNLQPRAPKKNSRLQQKRQRQQQRLVLTDISQLVTLEGAAAKQGRRVGPDDLGIIRDAALVLAGGKIAWVGALAGLPREFKKWRRQSMKGALVMPGLVDSHTHLVFAGDRSCEFEQKLEGLTYGEIAARGGGIGRTVRATRQASRAELLRLCERRALEFLRQGVTTLEAKTGYGLSFESEKKILDVLHSLKRRTLQNICITLLTAHALAPEFQSRKAYVEEMARWLPQLAARADFIDAFIDEGYFTVEEMRGYLKAARDIYKLGVKLHADELALTGGTSLAVELRALSADHLLKISRHEMALLAQSETVATLLPTTAFFLKTAYAPARALLDGGARVALASDYNPGTSPNLDVGFVGLLAGLEMKMTLPEIIVALTLNGAAALGFRSKGALLKGFDADFIVMHAESPARLFSEIRSHETVAQVWIGGRKTNP